MNAKTTDSSAVANKTARQFTRVLEIIEKYNHDKKRLITILQEVQEEYRYLPQQVLTYIATALDMPVAEVFGVATFYAHFSLEAKGKYVIKVCDGTACHVKGSSRLIDTVCNKLKLSREKHTTDDMLFTLEAVSCLGACGLAPVMVINDQVYGQVTSQKCEEIINDILQKENN
ncbi:NADH-quinone oxidoreductase subunit E [Parabacteroides sp. PF5-5]|uniref:NADH-quinone oxidoreductase subunit NuoE family protein n=1 Tax=unclassified Parabacteroides TaxID=2649774 RepID=UPI002473B2CC|nr:MULTISPECIES: NAD(P)H-dependent oxidoreductase subunit E [unclassified Parabacteroides]MDH6304885.1 NADH-quinone oxidoreductase subunit E [Parabacteroides sp. PH5-39]MDH6316029.1 NADH-quinone oxidoreductase subunit E [Parabacteroides sp. PF5-13]MDH6319686.1 NADH-quinone oxidoreductase subunit E [Parabacteroides sp. PH5-13]MDH6323417.1 NADH-quinone oxidoreductase subunit E [Parabacteroides sp. PH5-8]MDH6327074.1 NADH-quinone oxidoreductase subunit E [Parabacteroides sp. PH5-41]